MFKINHINKKQNSSNGCGCNKTKENTTKKELEDKLIQKTQMSSKKIEKYKNKFL